jgi:sortase A
MSRKSILRRAQFALVFTGTALLGYCAFAFVDAELFQRRANQLLEQEVRGATARQVLPTPVRTVPPKHSVIGRIEIPRIHLSAIVVEGDDSTSLRLGVGHVPGTALPGAAGNAALAGHRDTFFRALRRISKDDRITLTTPYGSYRYEVGAIEVVGPGDTRVLDPTNEPTLTLVTCFPFSYIGAAPERFVVVAHKVG